MSRTVVTGLLLIPAGAVVGFLCCAMIARGYYLISTTFNGVTYSAHELDDVVVGIILAGMLGGAAGAIVTPVFYIIGFTQASTRQLVSLFSLIAVATVVLGLSGAFVGPNAALFTTMVGFLGACATAYTYIMDHAKERGD